MDMLVKIIIQKLRDAGYQADLSELTGGQTVVVVQDPNGQEFELIIKK